MLNQQNRAAGRVPAARMFIMAALCVTFPVVAAALYVDGPPPEHTGGFGEPTCHACHSDMDINSSGGSIVLADLPDRYEPGAVYRFTVTVKHPELRRAGFELAFRFAGDGRAGKQAGVLRSTDARTKVSAAASGVLYAHHVGGSAQPAESGLGRWTVEWTAPSNGGPVMLHVAANAADYNDSPFGDRVYTAERKIVVRK